MDTRSLPTMRTGMLIRKPAQAVFEAFAYPDVTRHFWFSAGSGRLEAGRTLEWRWDMYGIAAEVTVKALEPPHRIVIEWGDGNATTQVEWRFDARGDDATFVEISETGFDPDAGDVLAQIAGSAEGFALALAGSKAWLEHGIELQLVRDRHPDGLGG